MRLRHSMRWGPPAFIAITFLLIWRFFLITSIPVEMEPPVFLEVRPLISDQKQSLELWGNPFDDQMTLKEYAISPKETFWALVEREHITLAPTLKQELLNSQTQAAQILTKLQPSQKIGFVKDRYGFHSILVEKDHDDLLISQKQVRSLRHEQKEAAKAVRFDIKIQKSISHDLSYYKVPSAIRSELIAALGTRFNLSKEVYKGNRLQLVYGKNIEGQWKLYKFSFNNGKKSVKAYAYEFDGCHFIDETGVALKKGFLEKPVEPSYISSYYSKARKHPVLGVVRAHKGIDFAAPKGTPVKAASDGKVSFMGIKGGYGNLIEIDHGQGVKTRYGHLDSFSLDMKQGVSVDQGQCIGCVGMTGLATGPHLHYEYIENGEAIDPLKAQKSFCKKLPAHENIAFQKVRARYDSLEQNLPITVNL